MVKVYEGTDDEFYMDGILKDNLDIGKRIIKKDWDLVFVIDGFEGTGKSVFTQQLAKYCDPSFNLSRIVFSDSGFIKAVLSGKKYEAIVYDEAYHGLSSRGAMTKINKSIVKMLTEVRQRNLFLFIVLPTIFELDKYPAIWRSRALFHVYADNFQRGYFAFYDVHKKKALYINGKKFYSYSYPDPNFTGRFTNHYTVNMEEYKEKKLKVTSKMVSDDPKDKYEKLLIKVLQNSLNLGYNQTKISEILGVDRSTVGKMIKKLEIEPNKLVLPT